jgi:hypothetical protein
VKVFVTAINFFHHINGTGTDIESNTAQQLQQTNKEAVSEHNFDDNVEPIQNHLDGTMSRWKQKNIRICCHKLQQAAACPKWIMEKKNRHQDGHWKRQSGKHNQSYEQEWNQLQEAEYRCRMQREELQKRVEGLFHKSAETNWDKDEEETEQDNSDLEYISAILGSFTNPEMTSIQTFNPEAPKTLLTWA